MGTTSTRERGRPISLDLDHEDQRPYFLWDEDLSVGELRQRLKSGPEQWRYYAAKILREANYPDVWRFLSLQDVGAAWESLRPILGRRREYWEFLISVWKRHGIIP